MPLSGGNVPDPPLKLRLHDEGSEDGILHLIAAQQAHRAVPSERSATTEEVPQSSQATWSRESSMP